MDYTDINNNIINDYMFSCTLLFMYIYFFPVSQNVCHRTALRGGLRSCVPIIIYFFFYQIPHIL